MSSIFETTRMCHLKYVVGHGTCSVINTTSKVNNNVNINVASCLMAPFLFLTAGPREPDPRVGWGGAGGKESVSRTSPPLGPAVPFPGPQRDPGLHFPHIRLVIFVFSFPSEG